MAAITYGHDEGVGQAGHGVGDLVPKLDVVVVDPASGNVGDAVEPSHTLLREESGQDVADDAADSMRRKDLNE